ncbi:protein of unknown function [Paraburkholderia dioscoreae]|uniref:Uncharacterized protein n=1 Tax=Paraburkholderia dioscoreae TaxID=2604047 RepID=A0A5Q4ZCX9_9BURK|nr:protein of unknown function [Paraburkholderia dioscoreae]
MLSFVLSAVLAFILYGMCVLLDKLTTA